ncbi:MAG: nucleotidyl transferase AbiEii/AbiGii toxin family protein [Myxococcaceae bacterium]
MLERIAWDLRELRQQWALVGGLAVGARSEPRFTRAVDLAIAVGSDHDAEQLVHRLQRRGYSLVSMFEHRPTGRIATVRLYSPAAPGLLVDLLFAASGVETETVGAASPETVMAHLRLPVAQRSHLLAMKVVAAHPDRRPQDFADIRALLAEASPAEISAVEALLRLVAKRGFSGRADLPKRWKKALARFRPSVPKGRGPTRR